MNKNNTLGLEISSVVKVSVAYARPSCDVQYWEQNELLETDLHLRYAQGGSLGYLEVLSQGEYLLIPFKTFEGFIFHFSK